MGARVRSVLDLAELLLVAVGLGPGTYGEVTVQRHAGGVRLLRRLETFEPEALSEMPVPGVSSEP